MDEVFIDVYQQAGSVSTNGQAYFETRCKMIAKYKDVLWKNGLFDFVVGELFKLADKHNYLDNVKILLAEKMGQK